MNTTSSRRSCEWLYKYILGASGYCFLRKPWVLSKHQVRTEDSTYAHPKYRNLLISEMIPMAVLSGVLGQFIAPFHLCQDIRKAEVYGRGLEKEMDSPEAYRHYSVADLLFV